MNRFFYVMILEIFIEKASITDINHKKNTQRRWAQTRNTDHCLVVYSLTVDDTGVLKWFLIGGCIFRACEQVQYY